MVRVQDSKFRVDPEPPCQVRAHSGGLHPPASRFATPSSSGKSGKGPSAAMQVASAGSRLHDLSLGLKL